MPTPKKLSSTKKSHLTDDKVNVYADSLEYFVNTKQAELYDNVRLIDGESELTSDRMSYNVEKQEGNYTGGGKMVNKETTLTSQDAFYNGKTKKVDFKNDVHLLTPDYDLRTTSINLRYQYRSSYFQR